MNVELKIISSYIQMLEVGHVKLGLREITKQEAEELCIPLLQAIAADIEAKDASEPGRETK